MSPRIEKLRAERAKNERKINTLSERNKEIDEAILEIENGEIVGIVRATGMNLDELAAYLQASRKDGTPASILNKKGESNHEKAEKE